MSKDKRGLWLLWAGLAGLCLMLIGSAVFFDPLIDNCYPSGPPMAGPVLGATLLVALHAFIRWLPKDSREPSGLVLLGGAGLLCLFTGSLQSIWDEAGTDVFTRLLMSFIGALVGGVCFAMVTVFLIMEADKPIVWWKMLLAGAAVLAVPPLMLTSALSGLAENKAAVQKAQAASSAQLLGTALQAELEAAETQLQTRGMACQSPLGAGLSASLVGLMGTALRSPSTVPEPGRFTPSLGSAYPFDLRNTKLEPKPEAELKRLPARLGFRPWRCPSDWLRVKARLLSSRLALAVTPGGPPPDAAKLAEAQQLLQTAKSLEFPDNPPRLLALFSQRCETGKVDTCTTGWVWVDSSKGTTVAKLLVQTKGTSAAVDGHRESDKLLLSWVGP